jgi:hypothetical protein
MAGHRYIRTPTRGVALPLTEEPAQNLMQSLFVEYRPIQGYASGAGFS